MNEHRQLRRCHLGCANTTFLVLDTGLSVRSNNSSKARLVAERQTPATVASRREVLKRDIAACKIQERECVPALSMAFRSSCSLSPSMISCLCRYYQLAMGTVQSSQAGRSPPNKVDVKIAINEKQEENAGRPTLGLQIHSHFSHSFLRST